MSLKVILQVLLTSLRQGFKSTIPSPTTPTMQNRRSFIKKSGLFLAAGTLPMTAFVSSTRKEGILAKNIVVTLYVTTGEIDKSDVNASCSFGQTADIANEDFTIHASVGDTVTWQGVSSDAPSTDMVNISAINHEGGKNVFGANVLAGNSGTPEKVEAQVLSKTPDREDYKYKISFTVSNNGVKRNGTFHIDPKIQVH